MFQTEESQMIKIFLETMLEKTEKELNIYSESLEKYYPWLYEKLKDTVNHVKKTDQFFHIKTLGGIPNLPRRIIERTELVFILTGSLLIISTLIK